MMKVVRSITLYGLLLMILSLSSCLTRKNALPVNQVPDSKRTSRTVTKKEKSKRTHSVNAIRTDATGSQSIDLSKGDAVHEAYAQWMGVSNRQIEQPALYEFIHEWMGVPHRDGGTSRSGIDCSGFVQLIFKEVYKESTPRTAQQMSETIRKRSERQLKEGDLVFFSFGKRRVDHVGIYLHQHKFVHVSTSKGVIVSDMRDPWYAQYFESGGSIR